MVWADCYEYARAVAAGVSGAGHGHVFEEREKVRGNQSRQKITQSVQRNAPSRKDRGINPGCGMKRKSGAPQDGYLKVAAT
jgi:hypothetical protein